jgi:hypothetical protein
MYFGLVLHKLAGARNGKSKIHVPCKMLDHETLTESQNKTSETTGKRTQSAPEDHMCNLTPKY